MNMARCEIYSKHGNSAVCQRGSGRMEMFMNLKCFGKEALREIFLWPCTNTPDTGKGHNGSTRTHTSARAHTHTVTHE